MELNKLVNQIKKDFEVDRFPEDWSFIIEGDEKLKEYATEEFLKRHRDLIFKNSDKVNKIYLACFPNTYVLREIAKQGIKDVLLITHHPFDWDGTGMGFKRYTNEDYKLMQENRISMMAMHVPWDIARNEPDRVSTAYGTAKKLDMEVEGEFEEYHGALISVYGKLPIKKFDKLAKYLEEKLGNKSLNIFKYGSEEVGLVALVPGGGNDVKFLEEAHNLGVKTYITGCTDKCQHPYSQAKTKEFLAKAKELGINIIGASHYLTEKWAMGQSVPYFERFGLPVEFIEDLEQLKRLD